MNNIVWFKGLIIKRSNTAFIGILERDSFTQIVIWGPKYFDCWLPAADKKIATRQEVAIQ